MVPNVRNLSSVWKLGEVGLFSTDQRRLEILWRSSHIMKEFDRQMKKKITSTGRQNQETQI